MCKRYFFLLLLFLLAFKAESQSVNWWWATNPIAHGSGGNAIVTDGHGNTYVTGAFSGTPAYFGPFPLNSYSTSQFGVLIVKYDSLGSLVWAKSGANINTTGPTPTYNGYGISLDGLGNCFVTGVMTDTGVFDLDTIISTHVNYPDFFIAKYDTAGNLKWIKNDGGLDIDYGYSIVNDSLGNSYFTGSFDYTMIIDNDTLISRGGPDIFIASYDPFGNLRWVKSAGDAGSDVGWGITMSGGYLYVTGRFTQMAIFENDTIHSNGFYDIFVAKYNTAGDLIWARNFGGSTVDDCKTISGDNAGNVYITGRTSDFAVFGNDTLRDYGIFIAKIDSSGNAVWGKHETWSSFTPDNEANSISTDDYGNSYITGFFRDTLIFQSDSLIGGGGLYVFKVDSSGNLIWKLRSLNNGSGRGISVDDNGYAFVTGYFIQNMMLDSTIYLSCPTNDLFTAKIGCVGQTPEISVVNSLLHASTGVTYQWYLNGNLLTGATSQDYNPPQNGNYVVLISDLNGCRAFSEEFYYGGIGISETGDEILLSVFPNPSTGIFTFNISNEEIVTSIRINNILGKVVLISDDNKVDLSEFSNDIYLYTIETRSGKTIHGRILKN